MMQVICKMDAGLLHVSSIPILCVVVFCIFFNILFSNLFHQSYLEKDKKNLP